MAVLQRVTDQFVGQEDRGVSAGIASAERPGDEQAGAARELEAARNGQDAQ
jgi:hypothetical protein